MERPWSVHGAIVEAVGSLFRSSRFAKQCVFAPKKTRRLLTRFLGPFVRFRRSPPILLDHPFCGFLG